MVEKQRTGHSFSIRRLFGLCSDHGRVRTNFSMGSSDTWRNSGRSTVPELSYTHLAISFEIIIRNFFFY